MNNEDSIQPYSGKDNLNKYYGNKETQRSLWNGVIEEKLAGDGADLNWLGGK